MASPRTPAPGPHRCKGIGDVPVIIGNPGIANAAHLATRKSLTRAACIVVLAAALLTPQPSAAQKLYSYEPLAMDPYSTIYVNDGSCSEGKVLKVQGAPRNQRRKKTCVPMSELRGVERSGAAR
jgi:hypothetical protein